MYVVDRLSFGSRKIESAVFEINTRPFYLEINLVQSVQPGWSTKHEEDPIKVNS